VSGAVQAPASLDLDRVSKRFGGVTAVDSASFTVTAGSLHGLIGPNGAGKSTLIGLISGFLRADAGRIRLGERELGKLSAVAVARLGLARTFQAATPFTGLSVRENLEVGLHTDYASGVPGALFRSPRLRRENRAVAARAAGLLADYDLADVADHPAEDLPFGRLRFLEIARAVARQPRVLLLDEPAAGLNGNETAQLADLLRKINGAGTTVLVIDHDVPFLFGLCDRITAMNFGSVIASDVPDAISRHAEVRAAYLGGGAGVTA
jgi:ABC-type branched-subunit amino acid transport system ATPase component